MTQQKNLKPQKNTNDKMSHTLKTVLMKIPNGTEAQKEALLFKHELQELFKREHQIAEDNQDLYYDDKLNELEREILGGIQE